jgi:hypothetical protein
MADNTLLSANIMPVFRIRIRISYKLWIHEIRNGSRRFSYSVRKNNKIRF